jgi:hypothetical protein
VKFLGLLAAGAAIAIVPAPAAADGESALSGSLGWATYARPSADDPMMDVTPDIGGMLAIEYERAFAEPLSWRIEIAGGGFGGGGTSYLGLAHAGAVYRFDVLKYVPYAFAGAGVVVAWGGPLDTGADPVLVLGGGLDVLSSRERSYGVEVRMASFAGDVTFLTIGVRLTRRWGYF